MTCHKTFDFKYIVNEPFITWQCYYYTQSELIQITAREQRNSEQDIFCFKNIWNASCALNVIPMFLLLSLDRRLCWWTISPRVYHPPLLSLDRRLCWWTISPRVYHPPLLSLGRRLCWWTISPRVYHPPVVSAAITGWYLCWWTISPRGYHPRSQCFYHWGDTSAGELLVPEGIAPQ